MYPNFSLFYFQMYKGAEFDDIRKLCMSAYTVSTLGDNEYFCNCKGAYTSGSICSHSVAARQHDGNFQIEPSLQRLQRAQAPGRPKRYQHVGFAAHLPDNVSTESQAVRYIGTPVVRRFEGLSDQFFTGKIDGVRLVGSSSKEGRIFFHITYPVQYFGDIEETEELNLKDVRTAHRLCIEYISQVNSL